MLKNFVFRLFLLTIALYGIMYVILSRILKIELPAILMLGLLFALNAAAYLIIAKSNEKNPASFVRTYLAVTFLRLIICGAFIFAFALTHKDIARPFAITFLLLYIIYVIIEARAIRKGVKSNSPPLSP